MTTVLLSFVSCSGKNGPKISANPASDFKYDLNATEDGIVIYKYIGTGKTKIRIPDTIEDLPVTEIKDYAFEFQYSKTGVPLGHQHNWFSEWKDVDKSFEYIYVPRTVTIVGDSAFYTHNVELENGERYLYGVSGLDIDISKLEYIGSYAFYNVKFTNTDIVISKNLQDECVVLPSETFEDYDTYKIKTELTGELKDLINENVINIYDVYNGFAVPSLILSKLNILDEVYKETTRRNYIISYRLEENEEPPATIYEETDIKSYILHSSSQFTGSNITSITFEDGTEKISGNMFYECPELVTVSIPASVKGFTYEVDEYGEMGQNAVRAFADCKNLENVNFAEGTQIEYPQEDILLSEYDKKPTTYYQPVFENCSKLSLKTRDAIQKTGYKGEF